MVTVGLWVMQPITKFLLRLHDDVTSCDRDMMKGRLLLLLGLRVMISVTELHLRCHDDVTSCDRDVNGSRG